MARQKIDTKKVRAALLAKAHKGEPPLSSLDLLSTGNTLLNLACSDRTNGGFAAGHFYWLVGDSDSGKTFLANTCFAEACRSKRFKDHRLIFDNSEEGALMDMTRFFGPTAAAKIEPPAWDDEGRPLFSQTVEDLFYRNLAAAIKSGEPFIYVQDSFDALDSEAEIKKTKQNQRAAADGESAKGSYALGKPKRASQELRKLMSPLAKTGSIVIIISQTRDNIGFGSQYNPSVVSGGRALKFFSTLQLWSKPIGVLRRTVRGKKRQVGVLCEVKVKKNRQTGKQHTVALPIYWEFGFDDVGGCINYLIEEGHWDSPGKKKEHRDSINNLQVSAPEFEFTGRVEKLIRKIEEEGLEKELRLIVGRVWKEIESESIMGRKSRYA